MKLTRAEVVAVVNGVLYADLCRAISLDSAHPSAQKAFVENLKRQAEEIADALLAAEAKR